MVQTFVCSHWRSISLIHVRHSSKNWTSTTLTSGPRSENERGGSLLRSSSRRRKSNRSRSVSRSSNSNSPSRASSQDPSHKTAYYPKSQLKHTVSLSALEPLKDSLEIKPKLKTKPRKNKPMARPLASPFVSRASSPVATHIPTSHENQRRDILFSNTKKRTALAETFVDSNISTSSRPTSRSRSYHRNGVPQHAHTSPERGNDDDAPKSFKSRPSPSPEHPENAKRQHTRGRENSNPLKRDLAEGRLSLRLSRRQNQDRERRPSAPSSLLRPRPRPLPFRVPVPAGDEDIPQSNASSKKHRLASGLNAILGPPIHHDDPGLPKMTAKPDPAIPCTNTQTIIPHPISFAQQKRRVSTKDEDSDVGMAWMHRRSGVNFNRPPSQMEFLGPSDGISGLGFGIGLDDPVFTSDDDGSSDEVVDEIPMVTKGRRLDLGLDFDGERFGEDAWGISTPFKGVDIENNRRKVEDQQSQELHRGRGSAGRLNSQLVPPKSPLDLKADNDEENGEDEGQDQDDTGSGEDMDLTASATFGYLEAIAVPPTDQHGNLDEGDMSPWITDSLISPPTMYLEKGKKVGDTAAGEIKAGRGGEQEGKTTLASTTHLSSPFRLTSPTGSSTPFTEVTENEQYESKDQEDKTVIEKQFNQDTATATRVTNAPTNKSSTRTRSGTIVPANPMPPGARRTRSGTIVGPLAAPPAPPSNKVFVGSTRRTRSGTIVANSSSVTGTQAPGENGSASQLERIGRARSGSMLKMKDRQIQPRPTANSDEDDVGARGTATPNKDPLPRNTLINDPEFEFDADSESEDAVECFADSLYVPRRLSSPDPIDFLRFASIEEGDDEDEHLSMEFAPGGGVGGMRWCVAEEPPSPEVQKRQGGGRGGRLGLFGGILRGRGRGKRGERKVSKNLRARFMGEDEIQPPGKGKEKETEMEDDELLLLPGDSARLWI